MGKSGSGKGSGMKKVIIGLILGFILLFLFLYFGGPGYLETFGRKTQDAGKGLKQYEKKAHDTVKKVEEKYEGVKKKFESDDDNDKDK